MKDRKNILLQYKGGGYEGCYWEWNFCFWDKDGKWHNIYSSGREGANTEQDALDIIDAKSETTYTYDLENEREMLDFATETNADLAIEVQKFLADHSINLIAVCQECKGDDYVYEMISRGGDLICQECDREHTCDYCGEYWDDTSDFEETDLGRVCEYCYEQILKDEQIIRHEEALEQAKIDGIIK